MDSNVQNIWYDLKDEIYQRITHPRNNPAFVIYFIIVILIVGIAAVPLTIFIESKASIEDPTHHFSHIHVVLSITGYYIALLAASAVDLILSTKDKINNLKQSIIMIGIGSIILGIILTILSLLIVSYSVFISYLFSILGVFLAWVIWWITNFENPNLITNPRLAIPDGTDLPGNESNFNV